MGDPEDYLWNDKDKLVLGKELTYLCLPAGTSGSWMSGESNSSMFWEGVTSSKGLFVGAAEAAGRVRPVDFREMRGLMRENKAYSLTHDVLSVARKSKPSENQASCKTLQAFLKCPKGQRLKSAPQEDFFNGRLFYKLAGGIFQRWIAAVCGLFQVYMEARLMTQTILYWTAFRALMTHLPSCWSGQKFAKKMGVYFAS